MAALNCLVLLLCLLLSLVQLITAAPQHEGIVRSKARDTIPPPPAITIGGYHYVPSLNLHEESLTTPPPPAIPTMTKDPVGPRNPAENDNDVSFTVLPPPILQDGGLHFAPVIVAPSPSDAYTVAPPSQIITMPNRYSITDIERNFAMASHVPALVVCPLLPSASFQPSASGFSAATHNPSNPPLPSSRSPIEKRQMPASRPRPVPPIRTAPFPSTSHLNISCSTFHMPTRMPVCRTTLSPLNVPVIPTTLCDQSLTLRSEHGYKLGPSSNSVDTLSTYFVVPWRNLRPGTTVMKKVVAVMCGSERAGCTTKSDFWEITITEILSTSTTTVAAEVTLTRPANVIAGDFTTVAIAGTKSGDGESLRYNTH